MLLGRDVEQRRLDELLANARSGRSETLVLVGEPGIGKTSLLDYAAAQVDGFDIVRARGVESEAELPFAALFDVCRPFLGRLDRLESQQATALRSIFGLGPEQQATGFAVGAATLSLLAATAEDRPLLLLVDDAHWLDRDSADALAFAVRRLRADAVAALFATRPADGRPFTRRGLSEVWLEGLDENAATELLERTSKVPLTADSRRAVLELASGNPLALLELPRSVRPGSGPEPVRPGQYLEDAFAARAEALPDATRRALVMAAASGALDLDILRRALEEFGLSLAALEPAESAGLLSIDGGALRFRHPLVRSALYYTADPAERRRAHAALAATLADDERASWHLAAAAVGSDEAAAAALERAGETARGRSGFGAAAAAYERAARLSERREERVRRLTSAADAAWLDGRTAAALALLEEAVVLADEPRQRGELLHTRGTIEHFVGDAARAHRTLEEAADLLAGDDPRQASLSLIEAVGSALFTGEVERALFLGERAQQIADDRELFQQVFVFVSRGATLLLAGRPEEALPYLERAHSAARDELLEDDPRNLTWAALAAYWRADGDLIVRRAGRAVEWARERAALALMPWAATLLGRGLILTGRWQEARATLLEGADAGRLTSQEGHLAVVLSQLAWLEAAQGRADDCRSHVDEGLAIAEARGLRWVRNWLLRAVVTLELGSGIGEGAPGVTELHRSIRERPLRDTPATSSWPDLIEAMLRLGDVDAAEQLLTPYADEAERLGDHHARALSERCRGLHPDSDAFEAHFQQALEFHARVPHPFERARTQLAYGELLRRHGRRIDARTQLRQALEMFETLEASPWAERARAELRATGERLRRRDPGEREELTPQELQIALVVAEGKSNREVGAQLFISPKTVEWHLGHIYGKLGVRSRGQLAHALSEGAQRAGVLSGASAVGGVSNVSTPPV